MAHHDEARIPHGSYRSRTANAGPLELRARWAAGESAAMGWIHIPSSISVEVMAAAGYDMLCIDMQHGPITLDNTIGMLPAILAVGATPIVRAPARDSEQIGPLLDAGALGIVAPQVNTRADAESFVAACRYPPVGVRSSGPLRVGLHIDGYAEHANGSILTFAIIETLEAMENLDQIVSTPGLDGVMLGPVDMSIDAHGTRPSEYGADLQGWSRKIAEASRLHRVAAAFMPLVEDDLEFLLALRPEILMLESDFQILAAGAAQRIAAARTRLAAAALASSAGDSVGA